MKRYLSTIVILLTICSISQSLEIPLCNKSKPPLIPSFTYSTTGQVDLTTSADLCHNTTHLFVSWFSIDDDVISRYTTCNDPLYNDDAVEIFIASRLNQSEAAVYFELEISPKGVLFFANIVNPTWKCSQLQTTYYPCNYVLYQSQKTANGWDAKLVISFDILNRGTPKDTYYFNMFRIDKSSTKPTRYLSWKPTLANPACFHVPNAFQQMKIVK